MLVVSAFFILLSVHGVLCDVCDEPIEGGFCMAYFPRFGYDSVRKECVEFIYGGCDGNDNNFATKEECEAKCGKKHE